jgi:hypothetical protein
LTYETCKSEDGHYETTVLRVEHVGDDGRGNGLGERASQTTKEPEDDDNGHRGGKPDTATEGNKGTKRYDVKIAAAVDFAERGKDEGADCETKNKGRRSKKCRRLRDRKLGFELICAF